MSWTAIKAWLLGVSKKVWAAILPFLKTLAAQIFAEFKDRLLREVALAQASGKSGEDKFKMVFEAMKDAVGAQFKNFPEHALNTAIEMAVTELKSPAKQ
jgi:hypothetical protein